MIPVASRPKTRPPTAPKISLRLGLVCWFAWYGDNWTPGQPIGRGHTQEFAIWDLERQS